MVYKQTWVVLILTLIDQELVVQTYGLWLRVDSIIVATHSIIVSLYTIAYKYRYIWVTSCI
ncbi:hypothetical protein [Mucilaginibacter agri]|uniref:Uncharacterized protein n=1 Tax=Mucilaginibacter agri TaxID=2695265 RepID=A0A966DV31_9SPHI|nr:hypothetical protein [Mucilaginibacter agri]NCD72430.1 hypothetical protein [Mucilaginibacter agri]